MDNKAIYLLAAKMLDMASDEFSNHGCNDLPKKIVKMIPQEVVDDARKFLCDDEDEWLEDASDLCDWTLMDYLAHKLKELANE